MIDFTIDCQTFLRLTDTKLGPYGLYVIETSGIRAEQTARDIDEFAQRLGSYKEDTLLLDFIRDARLPFPTTAVQLLVWQKENNDFELPEWLSPVIAAQDTVDANFLLSRVASEYQAKKEDVDRRLEDLRRSKVKAGDWYPVKLESERFLEILRAVDYLKRSISETPARAQSMPPRRKHRSDLLGAEIARALEVLSENATPTTILGWLKQQLGKPGSCIIGTAPRDGVIWANSANTHKTATLRAIAERVRRIRKDTIARQVHAKATTAQQARE